MPRLLPYPCTTCLLVCSSHRIGKSGSVAARHWFLVAGAATRDAGVVCFVMEGHAMKRILLACLLFAAACTARAQDLDKSLLLVAAPELRGPYGHTRSLSCRCRASTSASSSTAQPT